jgi:hypothetical protein
VIYSILHLHECADPTPIESAAATESAPAKSTAYLAAGESTIEPLHSIADYAVDTSVDSATPIQTS